MSVHKSIILSPDYGHFLTVPLEFSPPLILLQTFSPLAYLLFKHLCMDICVGVLINSLRNQALILGVELQQVLTELLEFMVEEVGSHHTLQLAFFF